MSFWSKLGKGLAIGGAGLATGMTMGGASPLLAAALGAAATAGGKKLSGASTKDALVSGATSAVPGGGGKAGQALDILSTVGNIAGQQAAGRATGRQLEAQNAILSNRQDLERAVAERNAALDTADLDLKRKSFTMDAPRARAGQIAIGDLMAGLQDVHLNIPGVDTSSYSVTGGIRPSLLTDAARQGGSELSRQALAALMSGADTKFTDLPDFKLPAKAAAPAPGVLDKVLGIAGGVLPYAGLIPTRSARPTSTPGPLASTRAGVTGVPTSGGTALDAPPINYDQLFNPRRFAATAPTQPRFAPRVTATTGQAEPRF